MDSNFNDYDRLSSSCRDDRERCFVSYVVNVDSDSIASWIEKINNDKDEYSKVEKRIAEKIKCEVKSLKIKNNLELNNKIVLTFFSSDRCLREKILHQDNGKILEELYNERYSHLRFRLSRENEGGMFTCEFNFMTLFVCKCHFNSTETCSILNAFETEAQARWYGQLVHDDCKAIFDSKKPSKASSKDAKLLEVQNYAQKLLVEWEAYILEKKRSSSTSARTSTSTNFDGRKFPFWELTIVSSTCSFEVGSIEIEISTIAFDAGLKDTDNFVYGVACEARHSETCDALPGTEFVNVVPSIREANDIVFRHASKYFEGLYEGDENRAFFIDGVDFPDLPVDEKIHESCPIIWLRPAPPQELFGAIESKTLGVYCRTPKTNPESRASLNKKLPDDFYYCLWSKKNQANSNLIMIGIENYDPDQFDDGRVVWAGCTVWAEKFYVHHVHDLYEQIQQLEAENQQVRQQVTGTKYYPIHINEAVDDDEPPVKKLCTNNNFSIKNQQIDELGNRLVSVKRENIEMRQVNDALVQEKLKLEHKVDDEILCAICNDNERSIVLQPCSHLAVCASCAEKISEKSKECPLCRGPIESVLRVYRG